MAKYLYNSPASTSNNNSSSSSGVSSNQAGEYHELKINHETNFEQHTDHQDPVVNLTNKVIPSYLMNTSMKEAPSDIKDFLSRPILCPGTQLPWTVAQARGAVLMRMTVPDSMLANTMYANKMSGVLGFRASLVVKFQTNAQKFQQGMMLISYAPMGPLTSVERFLTANYIWPLSQMPSVRHNIAETNETTLRVPFATYNNAFSINLDGTKQNYGYLYFTVYSPCVGGTVPYKCWVHFEDVELLYPSAQSGRSKNPSDKEVNARPISEPLNMISTGLRAIGNNIPLLGSVTSPPAWFIESLSKGFAAFGFSNAIDYSPRTSFVPRITSHANNCDVNDTVESHGLFASNKVAHLDGFAGRDIDEMSIQYIAGIPGFLNAFQFAATAVTGDVLYSKTNDLTAAATATITTTTGAKNIEWDFPAGYLARMFSFWRGSLIYRFHAVKTTFHTGRILFSFSPNNLLTSNNYNSSIYHTRYIWDISQTSEFEITIPYVSLNSFTSTDSGVGTLRAFVLTELEAPTTVASSIEILVEISAGPDFELSVPKVMDDEAVLIQSGITDTKLNYKKYKQLYINDTIPVPEKSMRKLKKKSLYKKITSSRDSKLSNAYCQAPLPPPLGGSTDQPDEFYINRTELDEAGYNSMYTTGETIKSLRSLLKRSMPVCINLSAAAGILSTAYSPNSLWYCNVVAGAGNERFPAQSTTIRDYYNYVGGLFACHRGSMIVRVIPSSNANIRLKSWYRPDQVTWYSDPSGSVPTTIGNGSSNVVYSQNQVQGALDVHVPFYSPTHTKVNFHGKYDQTNNSATGGPQFKHGNLQLGFSAGDSVSNFKVDILRQVGDDFSFGGFIGVMPVCSNYIASTPAN